ncbi:dihydroorotate dehydrogenase [Planococcus sp. YIM B11945]|uniref:dihydroorotate dehydrogenase n=1 Tax=Planococcus sp. YIM B11945 TaxID=3435410 RepID=UPI003D7F17A2
MPDWSYHTVFKPALQQVEEPKGREFIHRGMAAVSKIPGGSKFIETLGHTTPSSKLRKEFLGLTVSNPIGLSGKIDPFLSGTKAFSNLGFGFIEIGPVTADVQTAESPQYTEAKDNLVYPYVPESLGVEETIKQLERLKPLQKPLFIRIGATGSYDETLTLAEALACYGDAIVLEDHYSEPELEKLKAVLNGKSVLYADSGENMNIAPGFDGVIIDEQAVDTRAGRLFPFNQTNELAEKVRKVKTSGIPVIVSGGIKEPKDALLLFEAGADLVMLSSGYVVTGPGLPKRINEALLDVGMQEQADSSGWIWHWLFGLLMVIGGVLAALVSMTLVVLPYDEAFLGLTREELMAINPNIYRFMQHDRMTVAGTMISGGLIFMQLARFGVRKGKQWAVTAVHTAGIIGFLGILLFIGFGYFDWLHGLLWLVLIPFFWKGYQATKQFNGHASSSNRTNHPAWKKSLWGQLSFVVLGFGLILGGLVISVIGVTGVFVQTDLAFICMTPEQMTAINDRLIPVIAHDRAGLGSALISVGLLVSMLALWAFQEGQKWVWYTFLLGGMPAFGAAILIHYVIGYTTFIHVFPAYIALLLYAFGLIFSRDFFFRR